MLYNILKHICNIVIHILFKIKTKGIENFPMDGAVILYSNHKSMWDPVIIACLLRRPVFFMAKEELFKNFILRYFFKKLNAFPVKRGAPDRKAIRKSIEILNQNRVLGIFPEGTRSKDGKLRDPEAGIAMIAAKCKDVSLVPVAIKGDYKWFKTLEISFGTPKKLNISYDKNRKLNSQQLKEISVKLFNEISKMMSL